MDMPQAQPNPAAADPAMAAGEPQDAGYTIELTVSPDGQFTVSVPSQAEEAGEGAEGMEAPDSNSQSFGDIKSALTAILAAVKNDGKMQPQGADEDAFNSGYAAKNGGQPGV